MLAAYAHQIAQLPNLKITHLDEHWRQHSEDEAVCEKAEAVGGCCGIYYRDKEKRGSEERGGGVWRWRRNRQHARPPTHHEQDIGEKNEIICECRVHG